MTRGSLRHVAAIVLVGSACAGCVRPSPARDVAAPAPVASPSPAVAVVMPSGALVADVEAAAARIAATSDAAPSLAWDRLVELVDDFGSRMSGSPALEQALAWSAARLRSDGLANVRLEPVRVPHWVRGEERARIVAPVDRAFGVLALGGSVGTNGTLRAPLVAFDSLDALRKEARPLAGAIALVNHRMAAYDEKTEETGYREGVQARMHAASAAAALGARAVLVRSVTATSLATLHTGATEYASDRPKIPAAAVTIEDAEMLARFARRGPIEVELALGARRLPDAPSANAIGELRGSALPDEIVLLGAHLDSWDVGPGASDDAAGCIAVMEAVRLLRASGLVPRRTIRVVLFTAEEYGLAGAKEYHRKHGRERHVAAFETDYGMGAPDALGVGGGPEAFAAMQPFLPSFARFDVRRFRDRAYGADIAPLVRDGAAHFSLYADGRRYFDVHHSAADTLDKIRPEDLRRNAAAIALLAYALAMR